MSNQVIVLSPTLAFLPPFGLIVSVGRFNIEDGGQTIRLYHAPPGGLTVPAGQDGLDPSALLKLFEHLSGFKHMVTGFILDCDWNDDVMVVWLAPQQWILIGEGLQRLLDLTPANAADLLSATIAALAHLPLFDSMVRSMNRRGVEFRTDVAGSRVSFRRIADIRP